jgi:hypothetical protein
MRRQSQSSYVFIAVKPSKENTRPGATDGRKRCVEPKLYCLSGHGITLKGICWGAGANPDWNERMIRMMKKGVVPVPAHLLVVNTSTLRNRMNKLGIGYGRHKPSGKGL